MASILKTTGNLPVATVKGEARIDSRLLAIQLGNRHKAVLALIDKYADHFCSFGLLPFKKEAVKTAGARGAKYHRYTLLNEDQAFYALNLSRNTAHVAALKCKLTHAFAEARRAAQQHGTEYLPSYHELHDAINRTAAQSGNQHHIHANFNKLVNKAAGIGSGQRHQLTQPQQSMLAVAQHVAAISVAGTSGHRAGYAAAKTALGTLQALALGGAA